MAEHVVAALFRYMNGLPIKPGQTPDELARELREKAEVEGPGSLAALLIQAADYIEDLQRRLNDGNGA